MQPLQRRGHFPRGLDPLAVALPVDELLEVHAVDEDLRVAVVAVLLGGGPWDVLIVEHGGLRAHATKDAYSFHLFSKISSALTGVEPGGCLPTTRSKGIGRIGKGNVLPRPPLSAESACKIHILAACT